MLRCRYLERAAVIGRMTPMQAFAAGRALPLREDWESAKTHVMARALRAKFADAALQTLLVSTYPHHLVSVKPDHFWGAGLNGRGRNELGKILEAIREDALLTRTDSNAD